jgi:putative ABC transport system ATP-binding protein
VTATVRTIAVTRRYAASDSAVVTAVVDADLTVEQGEFVAIEGPSGSGKTTLLGLIAGIERADEGSVFVLGHELSRLTAGEVARLRRSQIGIVFQTFGLVAALSAGENVALPLWLDGVRRVEREARAVAALDEVGLGDAFSRRVDELSGGERQRVAIARALVPRPAVVLADEPSGSLDEANGRAVLDLLRSAAKAHRASLILVTHDPESAGLADRRYRMRDGALVPGDRAAVGRARGADDHRVSPATLMSAP